MSKSLLVISLLILVILPSAATFAQSQLDSAKLRLVPWPKKITVGDKTATMPAKLVIRVAGDDIAAAEKVANTFAADLAELKFEATVTKDSKNINAQIVLKIAKNPSLASEGYILETGKNIAIIAATKQGLFWGTRTALQLLSKGPGDSVPALRIADEPEYGYRAFMVDVAREFHSIDFHKRMVKTLSSYKMNFYHIHFSDDQSYTLPSTAFPALPTPGRTYTKEQLTEMVKLGEEYNVTIIPEIEMPGHASRLCEAVPELVCKGKQRGGMICPGPERSYEILEALISEAMDIFPGPYFHMGADEVYLPAWDGCPDCEARLVKEGLKDKEALYNYFINRMNRFVQSKGRRTIVWEGFKVDVEPIVDKNVLVEEFEISTTPPGDLIKAGYDIINASWSPLYVLKSFATSPEGIAEWNALYFGKGRPPRPLDKMLKIEPTKHLKGVSMCSWETEEAGEEALLLGTGRGMDGYAKPGPRLPAAAERMWTGDKTTAEDLLKRIL